MQLKNGDKHWYINDKRHRLDGPAIERVNGNKDWYLNNKLHRVGGPARELSNGDWYWYFNGRLHREDGPASLVSGGEYYYLNNLCVSEDEFLAVYKKEQMLSALLSMEKFVDRYGSENSEAGLALLKFLSGDCTHTFVRKNVCDLCCVKLEKKEKCI